MNDGIRRQWLTSRKIHQARDFGAARQLGPGFKYRAKDPFDTGPACSQIGDNNTN